MKKVMMAVAVIGLFGLSSCKKEYECVCTDSAGDETVIPLLVKQSKSDAESACEVYEIGGDSCEAEVK